MQLLAELRVSILAECRCEIVQALLERSAALVSF
jgi:hypothetical protein